MITIEELETLAAEVETEESSERTRLMRLIRAYARIIAVREPKKFIAMATVFADEDGHYDNSYPPDQEYRDHTGPRLIEVRDNRTENIATSGGFYYDYRTVTVDAGLFVARDGTIMGCDQTGTGRVGQFAAHPGDTDVDCTLEWTARNMDEVATSELVTVEENLRDTAFPLIAAKRGS